MKQIQSSALDNNTRLHWNYFLALERDLESISRYIEFCPSNLNTYSIELAHLLFSAASEVDTLAKCICNILDPNAHPRNINEYRDIIKAAEENETYGFGLSNAIKPKVLKEEHKQRLSALNVYIPRYSLQFTPWESWTQNQNPDWWTSYNQVKHQRNQHFNKATLSNASNALAGLLAFNYLHFRLERCKSNLEDRWHYKGKKVTRHMQPESTFLRFKSAFYDNPIAELANHIEDVSIDVNRLADEMPRNLP